MKIRSTFHVFVFLTAVLTFSMPFVNFAQQNSDRSEAEVAVAEDTNPVSPEAKANAEQDAENDFSRLKWLGYGMCLGSSITLIALVIGSRIADEMYPDRYRTEIITEEGNYLGACSYSIPTGIREIPNQDQIDGYNRVRLLATSVGFLVSHIPVMGLASSVSPSPPPERFIGKAPEYVQAYTDAYKSKMRSLRRAELVTGSVVGGGCILLSLFATQE